MLEGSTKKSLRHFRAAVSLGGTTEMTRNLSMALMAAGESQQALEVLDRHLAIYSSDSETRERYAATLRDIGDREKCVRELGRLIDAAEDSAPDSLARLHNNLGVTLAEMRDYDGGIHYLEMSLAMEADEVAYENLARVLLAARRLDKAHDLLEVYAPSFNSSFTWSLRGRLAELEGDYDDAKDSYQKAIDTQPYKAYGYAGLGKLLVDVDLAPDRAITVLGEGLKSCPDNLAIANNLAYAQLMSGDTRIARQILQRLSDESDPYFLTATRGLLLLREGHVREGSRLYNLAARQAVDDQTRLLVEQKKWIEIARYWLEDTNLNRARKALASAMKIKVEEQLFRRQLEALVAAAAAG
jgi:tetratricopeptide (TPR) repeat protein